MASSGSIAGEELRGGGASLWSTIVAARRRWRPSTGMLSGLVTPPRLGEASTKLLGSLVQGGGWAVKEDDGEGGERMGSLEMIGVFSLFAILCLFQRVITSQPVVCFSHVICCFEGIWKCW